MTIRLAVTATAPIDMAVLRAIKEHAGDRVEIAFHLGGKAAQFKTSSLSRMNARCGTDGHLMRRSRHSGLAEPFMGSKQYFRDRDAFTDHITRRSWSYSYKSHPLKDQQDFHDDFHVVSDAMAAELEKRRLSHASFFNVPHIGYDTALFQAAKSLEYRQRS